MVTFKQGVENHMPLIHHLLKVNNSSSFPFFPITSALNLFLYIYLVSFLHRAVCFEITLYLLSHFSYSSAAFCKIAQAGGGGQGQGELLCHGVVRCCAVLLLLLLLLLLLIFHFVRLLLFLFLYLCVCVRQCQWIILVILLGKV